MPKALHDRLERQARKKGLKGESLNAYVYGTMHNVEEKSKKKPKKRRSLASYGY